MQSNRIHEEQTAPAWRLTQAKRSEGFSSQVVELRHLTATVRAQVAAVREERHRLLAEYERLQATYGVCCGRSYDLAMQCEMLLDTEAELVLRWACVLQEKLTLQNEHLAVLRAHTHSCRPLDP
jgi:hypothetical protein